MIIRKLEKTISEKINTGKAIIILGARQTGKSTLLKKMFNSSDVLWLDGDETDVRELFDNATSTSLKAYFARYNIIVVDEAQRIKDIGLKLKLITDKIKDKKLVVSGSSAFELANKLNEPLTGRKWEYMLFPVSFFEMVEHHGLLEEKRMLEHRMIYGYYPEVVSKPGYEKEILHQLTESYLYKDILMWQNIKRPEKLVKLLQALALQLGNEVSYNELGKTVGLDNETVVKYIDLLEKSYVLFRLNAFSRNNRKELKQNRKIYFFDNGIRNSIISNFNLLNIRQDTGALWENFIISERMKFTHYNSIWANRYFWRTHDQQEIDYIEEYDGILNAYEIKWNPKKKPRLSATFSRMYPDNSFQLINNMNYNDFIS
jgi:predicted AAA+ superfamily ATPase